MLDWSFEYVIKRHAEERAKREVDARFFVEKWLEALVGPYLMLQHEPLPQRYSGTVNFYSCKEKFHEKEVVSMAEKLGWIVQVSSAVTHDSVYVTIWTGAPYVPTIDSKWDIEAVRTQKKRNDDERLKDVRAVISKAVENCIGELNGLPTMFPLEVTGNCWVNEHGRDLALLGWTVDCVASRWYLRKA